MSDEGVPLGDAPADMQREIRRLMRQNRQLQRDLATTHSMFEQSKRALLRTNDELAATIDQLQTTASDLTEARRKAEAASLAKGRFLATISHEMRTPLNGVLGSMELLLRSNIDAEQEELVRLTHQSAHSLLLIISDVLDFSKAEEGRIALETTVFDLRECAKATTDLAGKGAAAKGVEVRFEAAPSTPRVVTGDPTRLRQVLLNLLDNAVKFTSTGSVSLFVEPVGKTRIAFRVVDTGIGIRPDALERIFQPFVQEDESTTRRFGGTGLGLSICSKLVALMGGALEVESTVGEGSTFRFEVNLPSASAQEGLAQTVARRRFDVEFPGMKVLLVDDNRSNVLIGRRMLERLRCVVECASNGQEALERIARGGLDVVLMDCSMPVMDGFEATRAVRALPGDAARTQIVAMTAYAMQGDRERCTNAGMDDYLSKPAPMAELIEALNRARERSSQRAAA